MFVKTRLCTADIQSLKASGAAEHLTGTGQLPSTKNDLVPKVDSVEAEKPWISVSGYQITFN